MKKSLSIFALGVSLTLTVFSIRDRWTNLPGPTPQAIKLIKSMESAEGWVTGRVGHNEAYVGDQDAVVSPTFNIRVTPGYWWANIYKYNSSLPAAINFSSADLVWISRAYYDAIDRIKTRENEQAFVRHEEKMNNSK
jgi:hypothetical protein